MHRPAFPPVRAHHAGLTLLEVILSLAVLASVTVALNQLADRFADDTRNTVAAGQIRTFGEAARSYIKDNYAAVQAVATASRPAIIDLPTLIAAGKLPSGYQNFNAFGQSTCALVFQPQANRLQAMVVAEGGTVVGDPSLGGIVGVVGGSGGAVFSADPVQIRGAAGGWALPTASFDNQANHLGRRCDGTVGNVRVTPGHPAMALWFENGDTSSAFVARDAVPGRPELNWMNTPLVLNTVQPVDGACAPSGAIAQDGNGGLLSCLAGVWRLVGDGTCTLTTADLDALQSNGRCYNGANLPHSPTPNWVFVEVFRHQVAGLFYVTQRAVGIDGLALGKVWLRSQLSQSPTGGWGPWRQIADPNVEVANGSVAVTDSVNAVSLNATGNVSARQNVIAAGAITGGSVFASDFVHANTDVVSLRNAVNRNGSTFNSSDDWSFQGYAAAFGANSEPRNGRGSAYVNDVFLRSINKWASQLAASGMTRVQTNGLRLTSDADYTFVTVTISARYTPLDAPHTAFSDWNLAINGSPVASIRNELVVLKTGAAGHYWGYESYGVEQKQFNVFVPRNAVVDVTAAASSLLLSADIRVDLTQ